jgi:hypothetical protein
MREPVLRRESDAPYISRNVEFEADLEEFPDGAGTLNPYHATLNLAGRETELRTGNIQSH